MKRDSRKNYLLKLSICAMLVGLSIVIGSICRAYLTFGTFLRITFENLPIILAGIMFGPIYGLVVGASTDLLSSLITAQDINLIITLGAMCVGLVSGVVTKMCKTFSINKLAMIISACASSHLIGCLLIKTFGLHYFYFRNMSFWYLFGIRSGVYIPICIAEAVLIIFLLRNKAINKYLNYNVENKKQF